MHRKRKRRERHYHYFWNPKLEHESHQLLDSARHRCWSSCLHRSYPDFLVRALSTHVSPIAVLFPRQIHRLREDRRSRVNQSLISKNLQQRSCITFNSFQPIASYMLNQNNLSSSGYVFSILFTSKFYSIPPGVLGLSLIHI